MSEREMPLEEAEGWLDYWETVGLSSDPAALDERAAARVIRAELGRLRAASAAPPLFLTSFERDYVQALNAILASRGEKADVYRWRGHAEALRQVCKRIRRDLGLPAVAYTSGEWRAANGVYQQDYLDSIHGHAAARVATPPETTEH